ncbi:MAG: hypothetical protein OXC07_08610 [Kistimonas sp.]|nr:hypothetical protein [Kistimonas sp.]
MNPTNAATGSGTPLVTDTGTAPVETGATAGAQCPVTQSVRRVCQPVDDSETVVAQGQQPVAAVREGRRQARQPLQARECSRTDEPEPMPAGASSQEPVFRFLGRSFSIDRLDAEERRLLEALQDKFEKATGEDDKQRVSFLVLAFFLHKGQDAMVESLLAEVESCNPEAAMSVRGALSLLMMIWHRQEPCSLLDIDILPGLREWVFPPADASQDGDGCG